MSQGPQDPVAALTDKLVGVLLIVGLIIGGFSGLFYLQSLFDRHDTAVLRSIPDVLITWRPGGELLWPMIVILFAPLVLLPSAFGLSRWGEPPASRRAQGVTVALTVAGVLAAAGWGAVAGRDEVAVATPFGVSWLYDGKPREYWTWGAADSVGVGCATEVDTKTRDVRHVLNYDVTVPSGRVAPLVQDEAEIPRLITRLTPIDQSLRARAVPRFASVEAACLQHYERGLTQAEKTALRTLLSR